MTQIPRIALGLATLLAGLCPLVANSVHEDAGGAGEQILAAAADRSVSEQVSIALFLIGFAAMIVVLAVLAVAIARRTPVLAGVVVVAGAAALAIELGEVKTGLALRDAADVLDPGTAEALVAMEDAGFAVYGFLLSLALGAAGLGLLWDRLVPSWLGWWATVMGGLGVLTAAVGIIVPPYYVPLPFVLLLVWLVALGLTAARRPVFESRPTQSDLVAQ